MDLVRSGQFFAPRGHSNYMPEKSIIWPSSHRPAPEVHFLSETAGSCEDSVARMARTDPLSFQFPRKTPFQSCFTGMSSLSDRRSINP